MTDKANVFRRLQSARSIFSNQELKKTGYNSYSNFYYFQLQDFVPTINRIFMDLGLIGLFNYETSETTGEMLATMTIHCTDDPEDKIVFKRPAVEAKTSNNPIQNAGSTDTYLRRYMWLMAMDIVETDITDATVGMPTEKQCPKPESEKKAKPEAEKKVEKKEEAKPKPAGAPPATKEQIEIIKKAYPEKQWNGIAAYFNKKSIDELTTVEAKTITKRIETRKTDAGN